MSVFLRAPGLRTPWGNGPEEFAAAWAERRSAVSALAGEVAHYRPGFGAAVPVDRKLLREAPGGRALRPSTMSASTRLALEGLGLCLGRATWDPAGPSEDRLTSAVLIGAQTNMPDLARHLRFWRMAAADEPGYRLDPERNQAAMKVFGAFEFLRLMNNMPGAHAGLMTGCLGMVDTIVGGAHTGLAAIIRGARAVRDHECAAVVAGGAGSALHRSRLLHRGEQGFWAAAPEDCRPWQPGSRGSIPGEGAAFFLLSADPAGAAARVAGWATGFAPVSADHTETGVAVCADAIDRALRAAGTAPGDLGLVVGTGCGVPWLDALELGALERAGVADTPRRSIVDLLGFCEAASGPLGLATVLAEWGGPRADGEAGNRRAALVLSLSPEGNLAVVVLSPE